MSALPAPTGKFAVGTTIAYLTDSTRRDADFASGRPINVQLWYPAASAAGATAAYLADQPLAASMLRNQYYGIDSAALRAWAKLPTHSHLNAMPGAGKHALVAFSVGLGVARANYTSIAEELASHGMIVAMVESPLQGFMVLPNGREVIDTAGRYGEPAAHRAGVTAWAKDISFTLERLSSGRVPVPMARVAASTDWSRVGAFGHSSGGLVAIAACETDARVRACVDMDGGVASPDKQALADFVTSGVTKPTLLLRSEPLYDDSTLKRRGMTREQWEKRGEAGRLALEEFTSRARAPLRVAHVAGTGHFNFSDAPFVMPSAITRFGGRIIRPERGWTIITTTLRTYFESEFAGRGDGLDALHARFPELTIDPVREQTVTALCDAPEYHQFDFFAGDWDTFDVTDPGKVVARNHVTRMVGGCALREVYEQNDGLRGESINTYDPSRRVWHQTWVTNRGQLLLLEGKLEADRMVLTATERDSTGAASLLRGIWWRDGETVREKAERSRDGGATWTMVFDIVFRPHK